MFKMSLLFQGSRVAGTNVNPTGDHWLQVRRLSGNYGSLYLLLKLKSKTLVLDQKSGLRPN